MANEMVVVPKRDLEKLEEARLALYQMFEGTEDINTIMALTNITEPMWKLSHKKYPEYKEEECPA